MWIGCAWDFFISLLHSILVRNLWNTYGTNYSINMSLFWIQEPCFLNIAKVSVCWTARPLLGTQMKLLICRTSYNIHESESVLANAIAFAVVQYTNTLYSIIFFNLHTFQRNLWKNIILSRIRCWKFLFFSYRKWFQWFYFRLKLQERLY